MKNILIYSFSLIILLISACSTQKIPGVYRIDIKQGNEVTQEMINALEPNMTKSQVSYLLGTPLLIDTFHPDHWIYLYSIHPGNGDRQQRNLTLVFKDDKLSHIEGTTRTVAREDLPTIERIDQNVIVPLKKKNTGLFQSFLDAIGFNDDTDDIVEENTNIDKTLEEGE